MQAIQQPKKAIFLDRDGTINVDYGYVYKTQDCVLRPGVKEALHLLKNSGYLLILVTNQSGIGRGYYTKQDCSLFNKELERQLDIQFDSIYICPHIEEDFCACRKPKIKHVLDAKRNFGISLGDSYFIGDKISDIHCGEKSGIKTVYVGNDVSIKADYIYINILDFVYEVICQK